MKLLLVEDEVKIARALKAGFEQERSVVETAGDGETALAMARADEYDVIILDRMLPGRLDGVAICETLRQEGDNTPIIMLTAKGQIRDRVTGLNAGADDYLVKPFSFEELLARVRALLRRPQEFAQNILKVGDLTLDTITYEVRRGKTVISLSQTEYALLEYLMRNQGRVVSRQMIIGHVWDFDADVLENSVEVYISYLRNKVDKPFGANSIRTVRGFGYKLEAAA